MAPEVQFAMCNVALQPLQCCITMQITPPWLWWAWRELPASAQTLRYEIWSLKALGCLCSVEFEISLAEQVRPMESRISDQSLTSLSFYYKVHSLSILLKNNTILTDHLEVTPPTPPPLILTFHNEDFWLPSVCPWGLSFHEWISLIEVFCPFWWPTLGFVGEISPMYFNGFCIEFSSFS